MSDDGDSILRPFCLIVARPQRNSATGTGPTRSGRPPSLLCASQRAAPIARTGIPAADKGDRTINRIELSGPLGKPTAKISGTHPSEDALVCAGHLVQSMCPAFALPPEADEGGRGPGVRPTLFQRSQNHTFVLAQRAKPSGELSRPLSDVNVLSGGFC